MFTSGQRIGPYTLVRPLGRGAFGVVWLAERRAAIATTQVALKLGLDETPDLAAITREAEVWIQAAGHPNVLPIIEADVYDGQVAIVSEYAPDGSLDGWLRRAEEDPPSVEAAFEMTSGILAGLEHLHSRRIIHRDLKPANILLQGETPRLADFGIARVLKSSMQSSTSAGTPAYMAPEAFSGRRSEKTDLWSAGVIFYQLLTGRLPFPQQDIGALIGAIATAPARPLPPAHPALTEFLTTALGKEDRFASAAAMRGALRAARLEIPLSDLSSTLRQPSPGATQTTEILVKGAAAPAAITVFEGSSPPVASVTPRRRFRLGITGSLGAVVLVAGWIAWRPWSAPNLPTTSVPTPAPSSPGLIKVLAGHTGPVGRVVFSSDGARVLSASGHEDDNTIRSWDVEDGQETHRISVPSRVVAFSDDGARALTTDNQRSLLLWDVPVGQEIRRLLGESQDLASLAFSPDGRQALSGGGDGVVRLWDLASGREVRAFRGHQGDVLAVTFSRDGQRFLSAGTDQSVHFWDVKSGALLRRLEGQSSWVNAVAFAPDGTRALSCDDKGTVRLWDLKTGSELRRLEGHKGRAAAVAFLPDGRRALSGGDTTMRLWDLETGQETRRFAGHQGEVLSVAASPDGGLALSGGTDAKICVWELPR